MRLARLFLYSASVVLLLTAAAKFGSSAGHGKILLAADPSTGLQFGNLFRMVRSIEVLIALACFFGRRTWLSAGLLAWLATCFVAYRIGLVVVGWRKPCSCLGNLTDALHIPPQTVDTAMKIILTYLLIGSYAALFWLWRQSRARASALPESQNSGAPV
jgi:hypothetical protein